MKDIFKKLSRYRLFIILLMFSIALLIFKPDTGRNAMSLTFGYTMEMLTVIPPVFILMGLMDVWIPKEAMMKYMGKGTGIKGGAIAFLLGAFSLGPLYAAFPVAAMFIKKGVSLSNVFLFLGAWSTTKIPMLLFETSQLGNRFAVIRFVLNLSGIVILADIIDKTTGGEERESLYDRICKMSEIQDTAEQNIHK